MKGWVYVITNKAMPGLIKVGYSMKDPELRAAELSQAGLPHPYLVDYEVLVEDPYNIEQMVHAQLKDRNEGREWFHCSPEEAISVIQSVVGSRALVENFKRADRAKAEGIRQEMEAEEERRKREAALDAKRQEIIARYEPLLKDASPNRKFLPYFFLFLILFLIIYSVLVSVFSSFPKLGEVSSSLALLLAFPATHIVKRYFKRKASPRYESILAKREAELAEVENERARLR